MSQVAQTITGKESACNVGDLGSMPGLGRSPGEGKGNPLQYSGWENSRDYTVHGVTNSLMWLRDSLSLSPFPLKICVCMKVAQLYLTLWDSVDYTVRGSLQARILEWVAFPFSRASSQTRDQTPVSHIAGSFFTSWATRELFMLPLSPKGSTIPGI